VRKEVK